MRQEEQIKRFQEIVDQLGTAPAGARRGQPGVVTEAFPSGSGNPTFVNSEMEAERERALAALMSFKKFDPPTFDREDIDPWTVESWIDSIETVFEDLYTVERDKVRLAAHCLQRSAKVWWKGIKQNRSPRLPLMTWQEFRELILSVYFPDSEKRKLRDRFQKLRQGDRSVREYEREFFRIVSCLPNVVQGDKDRADCFVRGLRPDIFKVVHNLKLQTFAEVVDRALWIEQGNAFVREEREAEECKRLSSSNKLQQPAAQQQLLLEQQRAPPAAPAAAGVAPAASSSSSSSSKQQQLVLLNSS
ncbi:uncharacterized protein LOC109717592 [Ananas comosus]|uniref:Uncharacterized protein LOC109717592 n=1 Tax=Ananas comosus TaxID=4615 RepID=A0A6P5FTN7_ANACO|nr:uncharacterized protein LOC109717592 [Ananas comosus]